jgi:hypothetical protein
MPEGHQICEVNVIQDCSYLDNVVRRLKNRSTSSATLSFNDTNGQSPDQGLGIDLHDVGDECND